MIRHADWEWYGKAAHYICADRCLFHLTTRIGKFIISSVGDYRVLQENGKIREREEIGAGRYFETMVFPDSGEICDCGCEQPVADISHEIETRGYTEEWQAREGHLELCEKYAKEQ